jgi:hypothetical protein
LLRMFANKFLLLFTCLLDTIIVVSLVQVFYLGLNYEAGSE